MVQRKKKMDLKKIEDITRGLEGVRDAMHELDKVLCGGPASYYYERIVEYYKGCMAASKFKEGERVELKEDFTNTTGWDAFKHFMLKGAVATIKSVDYYKGKYRYEIEFDNETWTDHHGNKRVPDRKHCFLFHQSDLKRNK